jgi:hypothetical protein
MSNINELIRKVKFRSFTKIKSYVKRFLPNVTDKDIKEALQKRVKDPIIKTKQLKPLMVKIFSRSPNTYFHDLFDNTKNGDPRYFHLFIGTNTRYAVAHPLANKNSKTILESIKRFVEKYNPVKLTSDNEPAFTEKNVMDYLKSKNIFVHFVKDNNHSSLGIIDRFTRTLRDLNTPSEKSKAQSHDQKYRVFTIKKMKKLLSLYNNSVHSSIKCTPKEMYNDPELEKDYIFKCLEQKEKQETRADFEIKPGTYVRYILPRHDGLKKKRFRVSPEYYKVDGKEGNNYILMARDGTVITKPRFQLIPLKPGEIDRMKFAETIPGKWTGVIDRVIEDVGKKHVHVTFKLPDGGEYEDIIPKSYLK